MPQSDRSVISTVFWLLLGPLLFILILCAPTPGDISVPAQRTAAVAVWTAIWWLSGVIPLGATALLPFTLFPFLGVLESSKAIGYFAHWLNFLFLGGFLIAACIEKWNLHKRIALAIIVQVGVTPRRNRLWFGAGFVATNGAGGVRVESNCDHIDYIVLLLLDQQSFGH